MVTIGRGGAMRSGGAADLDASNPRASDAGRRVVLGTAGHIDHGKTALVRALTGVDTDRLPDEKRRGITIDLGFAALDLDAHRLAIVDVPGHERFLRNMLAGASGFDLALLVVAADDSVMPQTREHLEVLRLLGLRAGLVALSKSDLVEPSWADLVADDVRSLVAGTFLEGAPIIRTSSATGQGIAELRAALRDLCAGLDPPADPGPFRMAIDRAFSVAGHGTVVSGTVASGTVRVGDELEWHPSGQVVRVRGIHQHDRPVESASRGARAAINLSGARHDRIGRGDELATPGYLAPTRVLSAEVRTSPGAPRPLRHRARYRLHLGTAEVGATLALLGEAGDVEGGGTLAQLLLAEPVVAVHGEPFVLREESPPSTVGGGRVLQPVGRRIRRRDVEGLARLAQLRSPDPAGRIQAALTHLGLDPWTGRSLCRDAGVPEAKVPSILGRLEAAGAMVEIPLGPRRTARVVSGLAADLEGRLLRALGRLHAASPRLSAIPRPRALAALGYLGDEALVSGLVDRLAASGRVVADARSVALAGHAPRLSQSERKLKAEIADAYQKGGMAPPEPSEWAVGGGARASAVREILALLCEEDRIVHIGGDLYLDADVVAEIRRLVTGRLSDGSSLTMAGLRDLIGTTRKYAVPIGEYLDRVGLTRREGDARTLNLPPESP